MSRVLAVRLYVGAVSALALAAAGALYLLADDGVAERAWLIPVFAVAVAAGHVTETRLARGERQGESFGHEESFLVAMALLVSPLAVLAAFAAGVLAGNLVRRRAAVKAAFNTAATVLAVAVALLVVELAGFTAGAEPLWGAALVVAGASVVYATVNRAAVSGVLALAAGERFAASLVEDFGARSLVFSGNVAVGLLAGLAAASELWALALALPAVAAAHFALGGHLRGRAQAQRLADIVEHSSDGIVTLDRRGRVLSWNPASERITGYPAARVLGLPLADVSRLLEGERADGPPALAERRERGRHVARITAAGGETRWIGVARTPLPEGGSVVIFRDETARRERDEMEARRVRDELGASLVATVSHELRTPLTSILGFVQTLLAREVDPAAAKAYLEIVRDESARLGRLIDEVLDLRRIDEGRLGLADDVVDVAALARDQVARFERTSGRHRFRLELEAPRLPVRGERSRLEQAFSNLLSNAVKYSPEGGEVTVEASALNGRVIVSVRDEGLGIPEPEHARIFTRFFRSESTKRRGIGGSGLGLALTREIVEAHGGTIGFESAEGRGSRFYFELPIED